MKLLQSGYKIDFSHKINHLSFGDPSDQKVINWRYDGTITNELSGRNYEQQIPFGQLLVNYYLDISEEEYTDTTYTVTTTDEVTGETTTKNPTFVGFPYLSLIHISEPTRPY